MSLTAWQKQQLGLELTPYEQQSLGSSAAPASPINYGNIAGPQVQGSNQQLQGPRNMFGPPVPTTTTTHASVPQPSTLTGGNGGLYGSATQPATPAVVPRHTSYNGQAYNLSDPTQSQQYYNDVIGDVTRKAGISYGLGKDNLIANEGIARGNLNQQRSSLNAGHENARNSFNTQGINFNNSYTAGNAGRAQNAFSGNVFQSGNAAAQGFADNQHLRGLADLATGQNQEETQYGQQSNQLDLQGQGFDRQMAQDHYNLENTQSEAVKNAKDQLASNLGYYDARNNPNMTTADFAGKYNLQGYTPIAAPKVDLANLNPYATPQTIGNSPQAQTASAFGATPNSSLIPAGNQYGFNLTPKDQDYQKNFFKTGNPNPQ